MSLSKPRGKSWSYWFWKLARDLSRPKHEKLYRCARHNFKRASYDENMKREVLKCSGCGIIRTKYYE